MKISIITATYNREKSLRRAILSINNQSYKNIEKLVIDGFSTDGSINSIHDLISSNDFLLSEPDNGIYDALNKGIKHSTGQIIGFLHSDDLYEDKNVISNVAKVFSNSDINVVYGDVSFFQGTNINLIKRKYSSDKLTKENLAWGKMPAHPAVFIRREVYEAIGHFNTDFQIAADYDFLCRLVQYKGLNSFYIPSVLVRMQLGGASTAGIRNTILLNKEVHKALKMNDIYSNYFMLLSKYPSKLLQFLRS
ncbi:glycosyltransferase-like protein, family 2 [SAR86 cluster bacterium SAR86E]|uniref:Glycosyltransferase-like protein, family 2 n=1 Tax=SAR86 cluster bacterium SAR86E TaxID=1208365 RepID=K6GGW1_9GAMM|nr:glycosyltransferase-like protein, family 2 [SAR86 cluster bacterium SAR86E]